MNDVTFTENIKDECLYPQHSCALTCFDFCKTQESPSGFKSSYALKQGSIPKHAWLQLPPVLNFEILGLRHLIAPCS